MVDASGLPGMRRSNTGVAETDDPCTNRIVPRRTLAADEDLSRLCHRKSLTLSAPARLTVQCSVPVTSASPADGLPACALASDDGSDDATNAAALAVMKWRREPPARGPVRSTGIAGNCESPQEADTGCVDIATSPKGG